MVKVVTFVLINRISHPRKNLKQLSLISRWISTICTNILLDYRSFFVKVDRPYRLSGRWGDVRPTSSYW